MRLARFLELDVASQELIRAALLGVFLQWAGGTLHDGWYRAGGDMTCPKCGRVYYDHPQVWFLHVLCDGSLVKL